MGVLSGYAQRRTGGCGCGGGDSVSSRAAGRAALMHDGSPGPQHLIFDADDTLWENNIYFEEAFDGFLRIPESFLAHARRNPRHSR